MAALKFKGIDVEFSDGVVRTAPPLTLRVMQSLQTRLAAYTGGTDPQNVELVIDAVHASLARNYPDLKRDEVLDLVDIENMPRIMRAVMGASRLMERNPSGEAPAAGSSTGLN